MQSCDYDPTRTATPSSSVLLGVSSGFVGFAVCGAAYLAMQPHVTGQGLDAFSCVQPPDREQLHGNATACPSDWPVVSSGFADCVLVCSGRSTAVHTQGLVTGQGTDGFITISSNSTALIFTRTPALGMSVSYRSAHPIVLACSGVSAVAPSSKSSASVKSGLHILGHRCLLMLMVFSGSIVSALLLGLLLPEAVSRSVLTGSVCDRAAAPRRAVDPYWRKRDEYKYATIGHKHAAAAERTTAARAAAERTATKRVATACLTTKCFNCCKPFGWPTDSKAASCPTCHCTVLDVAAAAGRAIEQSHRERDKYKRAAFRYKHAAFKRSAAGERTATVRIPSVKRAERADAADVRAPPAMPSTPAIPVSTSTISGEADDDGCSQWSATDDGCSQWIADDYGRSHDGCSQWSGDDDGCSHDGCSQWSGDDDGNSHDGCSQWSGTDAGSLQLGFSPAQWVQRCKQRQEAEAQVAAARRAERAAATRTATRHVADQKPAFTCNNFDSLWSWRRPDSEHHLDPMSRKFQPASLSVRQQRKLHRVRHAMGGDHDYLELMQHARDSGLQSQIAPLHHLRLPPSFFDGLWLSSRTDSCEMLDPCSNDWNVQVLPTPEEAHRELCAEYGRITPLPPFSSGLDDDTLPPAAADDDGDDNDDDGSPPPEASSPPIARRLPPRHHGAGTSARVSMAAAVVRGGGDDIAAVQRVAAAVIERTVSERVAAAERTVSERVAAAERTVSERLAASERTVFDQVAATVRTVSESVAAAVERTVSERIAAAVAAVERTASERVAAAERTVAEQSAVPMSTGTTGCGDDFRELRPRRPRRGVRGGRRGWAHRSSWC